MYVSPIDSRDLKIIKNPQVESSLKQLELNGKQLEIEGYATVEGLKVFEEDRIRKTLVIVPRVNIADFRMEYEEYADMSDEEIHNQLIIEKTLENCRYSEMSSDDVKILREDLDPLSGFKSEIDLSEIHNGHPLESGSYDVFIKLEQLPNDSADYKYEKLIPLSEVKQLIKGKMLSTKVSYFSPKRVKRYNTFLMFDSYTKTLKINSTLLQTYNPQDIPNDNDDITESKRVKSIKRRFFKLMYILFCLLPINKNKLVFASDSRTELNGNFFFVYEELYNRDLNLKIKFLFNESIDNRKSIFELIKLSFHFATSKVILLDDFYPLIYPLKIRKNADLIQVWHAAGAFKTFGYSRLGRPGGPSPKSRNHRNYTKAVVSSEGVRKHYAEGFGISVDKVYPSGVPRSDIFFDEQYKSYVRGRLYNKYPYLKNKKVILFAPTFRGNGQASAYYPFESMDFKQLYEELNEEYVFLFKMHPFVKNNLDIPYEYASFFYDFSDYREINDLLLITDILITDYSSVCFEFALLNKPMLFYAFDVEEYIQTRDFYYDYFGFIPGPLVRSTEQIVSTIKNEEFELEKIEPFVQYFFDNTLGKASEKVVDDVIIPSLTTDYKDIKSEQNKVLTPPSSRIELFERSFEVDQDE